MCLLKTSGLTANLALSPKEHDHRFNAKNASWAKTSHMLAYAKAISEQKNKQALYSILCDLTWSACAGADRHPELLSDLFTCLSNIFKHLNKHVAPKLNSVLRSSARLRYSEAAHVRQLAADAVGYLFRHVSQSGLKSGVQTLLAEQALQPSSGKYTCFSAFLPGFHADLYSVFCIRCCFCAVSVSHQSQPSLPCVPVTSLCHQALPLDSTSSLHCATYTALKL